MNRKALFILTVIFTCLSILYAIFSYFGYSRYVQLYSPPLHSKKKLLENYKTLEKCTDNKVIVGFTTTSDNINKLSPMLNSLLDQTTRVDQFIFVKPNNIETDKLPEYLKQMATIVPGWKPKMDPLDAIQLKERECSTMVIIVESDVIYGKDFIEIISDEITKNPNKIVKTKDGYAYGFFNDTPRDSKVVILKYTENFKK